MINILMTIGKRIPLYENPNGIIWNETTILITVGVIVFLLILAWVLAKFEFFEEKKG